LALGHDPATIPNVLYMRRKTKLICFYPDEERYLNNRQFCQNSEQIIKLRLPSTVKTLLIFKVKKSIEFRKQ